MARAESQDAFSRVESILPVPAHCRYAWDRVRGEISVNEDLN